MNDFQIIINVTDSELSQSEWVDYLIWVFQVGRQHIEEKDIKKFFWDLPSKY